jgi:hypothetical protein
VFGLSLPSNDLTYTCHNSGFSAVMSKYTKNTAFYTYFMEKGIKLHALLFVCENLLDLSRKRSKKVHGIKISDVER